jgi:hypothetical protein
MMCNKDYSLSLGGYAKSYTCAFWFRNLNCKWKRERIIFITHRKNNEPS